MRFVLKVAICGLLALAACATYLAMRSGDTVYTVSEWISPARFKQHDELIRTVAAQHGIDPMLVKAVVWSESRFDPRKFGSAGERGLMQVTERAASEWVKETHVENFQAEELFDPQMNLQAGTWYLARAMQHWKTQSDPVPFALAEYNAGASRAQRWAGGDEATMSPDVFRANIDFPGTRKYVDAIMARLEFYKRRGRM